MAILKQFCFGGNCLQYEIRVSKNFFERLFKLNFYTVSIWLFQQGMAAVYLITYCYGYHVWNFSMPFFHYRVSAGNLFELIMHGKSQTKSQLCYLIASLFLLALPT